MPKSTIADGLLDKRLPITVVDLSEDATIRHVEQTDTLSDILDTSTDSPRTLRWINIRSPHWHVARALAEQKKLDCLWTDSSPDSRMPLGVYRCSNCIRICFMMLKLAYPPTRSIEMSQFTTGELNVDSEPVFMYITPDNTIITLFEDSATEIETCILKLLEPATITGQSCDAFMLAQAIIDIAVDRASAFGSGYMDLVTNIEIDILRQPNTIQARHVHALQNDVTKICGQIRLIADVVQQLCRRPPPTGDNRHPMITRLASMHLESTRDCCLAIGDRLRHISEAVERIKSVSLRQTGIGFRAGALTQLSLTAIFCIVVACFLRCC